jgi:SpoVK/Ycf46/Vps4 family AAA+-type ATPase
MDFDSELHRLIAARCHVILIETTEELRAVKLITDACSKLKEPQPVVSWDIADHFKVMVPESYEFKAEGKDQMSALTAIEKAQEKIVFVLKDFHEFWDNPLVKRKLRNLSQRLTPAGKTIIIINPSKRLPDELKDEVEVFELPMPREKELDEVLKQMEAQIKNVRVELSDIQRERFLQAALGLSSSQAKRVFRKAAAQRGVLDESHIKVITEQKRQVIKQSEALEFFPVSETMDDIGGLEQLKEWLELRRGAFSEEARKYKLPSPKGVAFIGIPGTGKSLTAKAIGSIWRLPLLRMDVGALFGGLVGESEERTRKALSVANTISPCILWIDEMEKAFGQGDNDGGTSTRVFGSILTWMQEKTAPVFVVATANNISKLPPELLRKGRFDEVFFLDLPTEEERKQIFSVLLKKYGKPPEEFDLEKLAKASNGFVGAEIETSIIEAMYLGFSDKRRPINEDDILASLKKLIPLAESQKGVVSELRSWLIHGRAVSASYRGKKEALEKAPQLESLELMVLESEE